MLLIFIFSSDEETRLVRMHPEVCCFDTTFGTNNEKKVLFTVAFLDGNKMPFNGARTYIPNEQRWMFHTLFKYCLPIFWGPTVRERMNLIMTAYLGRGVCELLRKKQFSSITVKCYAGRPEVFIYSI